MLSATQVVVTAVSMFVLYRYLLVVLGAARLGAWSIVMAASSIARITDMGFAGGLTRFVAKHRALGDTAAVQETIQTGSLTMLGLVALVLAVAYPALSWALPTWVPEAAQDAQVLLPYALASLGGLTLAGAFLSSLDGVMRTDLRNLIMIASTVLYVVLAIALVGRHGLVGLGWAQVAQALFVLLAAWATLRRQVALPLLPRRWSGARFREMIGYNLHLQVASLASLLGDPAAKMLLGRFGDLASVGYFEMAAKLVSQFRAIVVNVNQVLVPVIAHLKEANAAAIHSLHEKTHRLVFLVATTFFGALLACAPMVSLLWLGEVNATFLNVCAVMLPAMAINTLASAAYFSNLGSGDAAINARVQVGMGLANVSLGVGLGAVWQGSGVILAYGLSIALGGLFLMWHYHRAQGIALSGLLARGLRWHLALTATVAVSSFAALPRLVGAAPGVAWAVAAAAVLVVLYSAARTSATREIWRLATDGGSRK